MSLINFLNPKLKPLAECDAVCEDGYSAANLVADDSEQFARGFMGFAVTKPPVDILFEFPKALDLKVIKLWNTIGSFRSTAFEVHGKYDGIWERVAFVRDLDKGVDSITFCYQSDCNPRSNTGTAGGPLKVFFFKTAHKILSNTNSIKITIRGTQKCPPVLKKVEVWGLPSRALEMADRELLRTIWSEITNPYDLSSQTQPSGQRSPSRYVPELNANSTLEIPEEFLDTITWELMIFPTVLPSGKVVDQSTIDKHSEVEARWGRLPSDPFTGLEFTQERKAILNLSLKARIEKFLMEKANHFKTVPRSLGSRVRRSRNRHASQFASPYQKHSTLAGTYSCLLGKSYKATSATCTSSSEAQPPAKRAKLSNCTNATTTTRTDTPMYTSMGVEKSTSTSTVSVATTSTLLSSSQSSLATATVCDADADTSTSGIDKALQEALSKITRFTQPPSKENPQQTSCIRCKSLNFSYEIATCKHLVCRKCLIALAQENMCICKVTFVSSDVERYHRL